MQLLLNTRVSIILPVKVCILIAVGYISKPTTDTDELHNHKNGLHLVHRYHHIDGYTGSGNLIWLAISVHTLYHSVHTHSV